MKLAPGASLSCCTFLWFVETGSGRGVHRRETRAGRSNSRTLLLKVLELGKVLSLPFPWPSADLPREGHQLEPLQLSLFLHSAFLVENLVNVSFFPFKRDKKMTQGKSKRKCVYHFFFSSTQFGCKEKLLARLF